MFKRLKVPSWAQHGFSWQPEKFTYALTLILNPKRKPPGLQRRRGSDRGGEGPPATTERHSLSTSSKRSWGARSPWHACFWSGSCCSLVVEVVIQCGTSRTQKRTDAEVTTTRVAVYSYTSSCNSSISSSRCRNRGQQKWWWGSRSRSRSS